jgi:iron(III) transport system permease protein
MKAARITTWRLGGVALGALLVAVFAAFFAYPLLRFLALPVFPGLGPLGALGYAAGSGLSDRAVFGTLALGLATACVTAPLGVAFGFLLECRSWHGNRLLSACLWLIFVMPSYLIATGGQILFGSAALRGSMAEAWFFSAPGIVALLALKALPFACLAARTGWRAIGGEIGDAARLHVACKWRRAWILLRLLLPSAGSAFVIVFIEVIQDFGIAATLGAQIHMPLIIYAIYERLAAMPVDFGAAAALSWYLVLFAGLAMAVHLHFSIRYTAALVHGRRRHVHQPPCTKAGAIVATLGLVLVATAGLVVPLGALFTEALLPSTKAVPGLPSLGNSAAYAVTAATLALLLAALLTARAQRSGRLRHALDLITLGNMAVPGLVLGAAYVIAFNESWLPLYGTPLLLVIAYVAGHVPMLVRFLQAPLGQLHANLADAGRIHGLRIVQRIRHIHAPLLSKPLLWGWCLAFAQILFELPVSELLYPAGRTPLGVQLLQLDQTFNYAGEARLAFCAIALCLVVIGLVALLAREDAPSPKSVLETP